MILTTWVDNKYYSAYTKSRPVSLSEPRVAHDGFYLHKCVFGQPEGQPGQGEETWEYETADGLAQAMESISPAWRANRVSLFTPEEIEFFKAIQHLWVNKKRTDVRDFTGLFMPKHACTQLVLFPEESQGAVCNV